ncbi:MAG: 50S ribosomal protein L20 [Candidatus Parcubacteria bacterium]|nr:50S ribosomal protein L20 [Candidatus Paceibacterota bacterium]
MSRVKGALSARKHRNYLLKRAKGYLNGAKNKFRLAKERLLKADSNAYKSRRLRKREFRALWIARINGALDQINSSYNYSRFMHALKVKEVELNRKSLSEMAINNIDAFKDLVNSLA